VSLKNGPYTLKEYPEGGIIIHGRNPHKNTWEFVDDSPNMECVENFLKAAAELPPYCGKIEAATQLR
jgi:hypothetical protein